MKFHPDKCKILSVNNFHKNSLQELPFYYFPYELDNVILDYTDEEKDLGILTTTKFNFKAHQTFILNKAVTQFNILRRTCHFVNNSKKRRTRYLTSARSLFNHCSEIWCPSGQAVVPFENFQKRCIIWILKETYMPYSESERESDSFSGFKKELDKYFWSHITSVHIRIPESDREPD